MVTHKNPKKSTQKPIESYDHKDKKRLNNPPVGLVTPQNDPDKGKKQTYAYDPHLDPQLDWAGKTEHSSFLVPTVSLHVHERIDPQTIIEAVSKVADDGGQLSLFDEPAPLRQAVDFYQHKAGWSNRMVAGDSLLVMNSLLEKEAMAGKVQMIYIDPPYGIKYGSNFQPFTNKRDVKDSTDEDLTREPETIKAFRDTWELGIHSYLTYMRDRLLLAREMLTESGSCFVQISDENVHHIRELMDEVFGVENFVSLITFRKANISLGSNLLGNTSDYICWYAKSKNHIKYSQLFEEKFIEDGKLGNYKYLDTGDSVRRIKHGEKISQLPDKYKLFTPLDMLSSGYTNSCTFDIEFRGHIYKPKFGKSWKTNHKGFNILIGAERIYASNDRLYYKLYYEDYPVKQLLSVWTGTRSVMDKIYAVQTDIEAVKRCMLMTTDPGDLVFDPTCGSGTTAYVAEQWGRRWITCDTSRVALTLAKQRLMTASFDYYKLAHPNEGVGSGFDYKTVPHVTLKSIANNEPPATETLYDQPYKDTKKARVTGPFTVEAVPAPAVQSLDDTQSDAAPPSADTSIARSGETLRQSEWRAELLRAGVRGKNAQMIKFSYVEPLSATRWLHAKAETLPSEAGSEGDGVPNTESTENPQHLVVSFGPQHAPLEQKQVALAIEEAQLMVPQPKLVIFAAFQFDPEAAKDIDQTNWAGVTLLKAQMNADLLTDDLRKKRSSNESFWLVGQPDVQVETITDGEQVGKIRVSVQGFDYYNTKTGTVESGNINKIAMWMLDTDYDGRSLYPRQVFFPMASNKDGWSRLAKNLRAEIDEELVEAYRGSVSLPFSAGEYQRVAVKIVDDRGIESLRIINITQPEVGK